MYQLLQQGISLPVKHSLNDKNATFFSIYNDLSVPITFRSFSIKFVFEGHETYHVNGNAYELHKHEYLLANKFCEGKVNIDSNDMVKGICIDVSTQILSEAFGNFVAPDSPFPDISLDDFFYSELFLENKYKASNTKLGSSLLQLANHLNENPFCQHQLTNDLYFTLAHQIVEDHQNIITQLYNVKTAKHKTRKDLYRRLCKGKEYIEAYFENNIFMSEVATFATLSEYHFFRLFKAAFGITPYQYVIQLRLLKAKHFLDSGNYSISEAALKSGFSDIHAFSKSFKKFYGVSPLFVIKKDTL